MSYKILVINPGSTSTKIAMYEDKKCLFSENIIHTDEEIKSFDNILLQFDFRKDCVLQAVERTGYSIKDIDAVVGRGGQIPNLKSGGYLVTDEMKRILRSDEILPHASNLGALIADAIATPLGKPAYIYDAIGSDEILDVARITGIPEVTRHPFCHVLNTKAMGRKYAESIGRTYNDMNLLIAHLGGGISISAHQNGRIIDVISDDGGPFSPERAGSFPMMYLVDMCYSSKFSKEELSKRLRGNGGMKAYLGTSDCRIIEERIESGDEYAKLIYEAQAYQIAKGIGNLMFDFKRKVDCVILTGGIAYSKRLTGMIKEYIDFFVPVVVLPGENEMEALALGAYRILCGEESFREYK